MPPWPHLCHLWITLVPPGVTLDKFRQHAKRMGASAEAVTRIFYSPYGFNVGRLTRYSEDWYTVFSSLGVCNRAMVNRFYHIDTFSDLFTSATGIRKSPEEMMIAAERAWNLLRVLNKREGFSRQDDCVPDQWFAPKEVRERKDTSRITSSSTSYLRRP